jgi:hypothetical protein
LDDEKLALFKLEAIMPPDEVSVVPQVVVGASDHLSIGEDHRSLQESCDSSTRD